MRFLFFVVSIDFVNFRRFLFSVWCRLCFDCVGVFFDLVSFFRQLIILTVVFICAVCCMFDKLDARGECRFGVSIVGIDRSKIGVHLLIIKF